MKKKLCAFALIGLFVTALVPASAPADNEPPYWTPCPTSTTTTTTDPATTDPTATTTTCPPAPTSTTP